MRRLTPTTTPRTLFGSGSVGGRSNAFTCNQARGSSTYAVGVGLRQFPLRKKWDQRASFSASILQKNCLNGVVRKRQSAGYKTWNLGLVICSTCVSRGRSSTPWFVCSVFSLFLICKLA